MRHVLALTGALLACAALTPVIAQDAVPAAAEEAAVAGSEAGLQDWIGGFRARALAKGIAGPVFDRAMDGARFDAGVIEKDLNQAEFTKTIWDYLDKAVSDLRITLGQEKLRENAALLDRIEAAYGVEKEIVVAIWGLESSYGAGRGDFPLFGTLASLAYGSRRGAFFEEQLTAALAILESGDTTADRMLGSWAGAMGHTQFMPTSYQTFAVDFTGDGRRDIWGDDPADALASTAVYLAKKGWKHGQPWGLEVTLPEGFDYAKSGDGLWLPVPEWTALGVRDTGGGVVADHGLATLRLPAGAKGAAFLTFRNFQVIEAYNMADAYVIAVGHLADRLKGGGPVQAGWPRGDRALRLDERLELQALLTAKGFDAGGADGKIGPKTIAAIKAFQHSLGLAEDGYASLEVLGKLR